MKINLKRFLFCGTKTLYIAIVICSISHQVFSETDNIGIVSQSHDDIVLTAQNFIASQIDNQEDDIQIHIKALDNRLKLHACTLPLQAFWPPGATQRGHTSVGIRCNDNKPWKIFVSAQIKQYEQVWIANSAISRGTLLDDQNIRVEKREISVTHSEYFNVDRSPVGLKAKRPLRKGMIIPVIALEKPMAIQRGDRVVVIARIGGLEIRTAATALSSGAEGDRIKVKNLSSNKELEGILSKNSVVYLNI